MRPDSTDLKAEIAASWKVFWNDEPAPFSVPLAAAPLDVEPPAGLVPAGAELGLELEEHAARRATATAPPTVARCFLPRSCISGFSLGV